MNNKWHTDQLKPVLTRREEHDGLGAVLLLVCVFAAIFTIIWQGFK